MKQSSPADDETVDKTFRALLNMLTLSKEHRGQLRNKRGLTDEQIDRFGYKSTPPFYKGRPLAERLIAKGYTVWFRETAYQPQWQKSAGGSWYGKGISAVSS